MKIKHIWVDLSLFDGEGAEGAEGAPTGENSDNATESDAETQSGESNTSDADSEPTEEERARAYQQFKKDYKDLYAKDFQETFNRRFKDVKEMENQLSEYSKLMRMLKERYEFSDVQGAIKALENDDAYWEQLAYEKNMSVEQVKEISKYRRLSSDLQAEKEALERQAIQNQIVDELRAQELEMQEIVPDFNLDDELNYDPNFKRLVENGVPIRQAYEVIHFDEVKNAIIVHTAQQTQKQVTDNIKAKGSRPVENGASSSNAFSQKVDVSKLTDKEMDDYIRRAQRGESISFN